MTNRVFSGGALEGISNLSSGVLVVEPIERTPTAGGQVLVTQPFEYTITTGAIVGPIVSGAIRIPSPLVARFKVFKLTGTTRARKPILDFIGEIAELADPITLGDIYRASVGLVDVDPAYVREGESVTRLHGNGVAGQVPIQQADGSLVMGTPAASVPGAVSYQGLWNATTNVPAIPAAASGNNGNYYLVSVAGSTSVDGISDWKADDMIISNGTTWEKIDNTDAVVSVNGQTGAVDLSGTYYTKAEVDALVASGFGVAPEDFPAFNEASPDSTLAALNWATTEAQTKRIPVVIRRWFDLGPTNRWVINGSIEIIGIGGGADGRIYGQQLTGRLVEIVTPIVGSFGFNYPVKVQGVGFFATERGSEFTSTLVWVSGHCCLFVGNDATGSNANVVIEDVETGGGYDGVIVDNLNKSRFDLIYTQNYLCRGFRGRRTDNQYDAGDNWIRDVGGQSVPSTDSRFVAAGAPVWVEGGSGWKIYGMKSWPYHARQIMIYLHNTVSGDGLANVYCMIDGANFDAAAFTQSQAVWVEFDSSYDTNTINGNRLFCLSITNCQGLLTRSLLRVKGPKEALRDVVIVGNNVSGGGGCLIVDGSNAGIDGLTIVANHFKEPLSGQTKWIELVNGASTANVTGRLIGMNNVGAGFTGGSDLPLDGIAVDTTPALETLTPVSNVVTITGNSATDTFRPQQVEIENNTSIAFDAALAHGTSGRLHVKHSGSGKLASLAAAASGYFHSTDGAFATGTPADNLDEVLEWYCDWVENPTKKIIRMKIWSLSVSGLTDEPATGVTDTYTDTNGTTLASHTADSGQSYSNILGTCVIDTNKLKIVSPGTGALVGGGVVDAGQADGTISIDITAGTSATSYQCGMKFNYVDDNNYWQLFIWPSDGIIRLVETTAGSQTVHGSTAGLTFTNGVTYNLKAITNGNDVLCKLDDVNQFGGTITVSNRPHKTATKVGPHGVVDNNHARYDNLSVV